MCVLTTGLVIRPHGSAPHGGVNVSQPSTNATPVPDLVIEYETLLGSLLPKLDQHDRTRVLEKVTLPCFSAETQFSFAGELRRKIKNKSVHNIRRIAAHRAPTPLAVVFPLAMSQKDFLVLALI
jgi:FPC/CPF motif-containing protein YcgG